MEKNKKVHLNKNEIQDVNGGGGQCPHCHGELPPLHPIVFGPPPPRGHCGPPPPGVFHWPPPHHRHHRKSPWRRKRRFRHFGGVYTRDWIRFP